MQENLGAMALRSTRSTPRVDALPREFDLLTGNRAITALAKGRTLADAQHDLHRHCRCPLWYARPHTIEWWDKHAHKSPTPARVLTMLLAATCANAYAFVSSRACEVVRGTARRVRLLLANPRQAAVMTRYALVMTFHFLAQLQLRVAVPLKKMWRVCESRFEGLAARIRSAGDAWDYGDPGMTGVIGWGEFRGYRLFGGYVGSGENGASRCARHAMGTVNHADASLVITVDSGREVDGREGTDFNCEAEDLVRKESKVRRDFLELLRARMGSYEVHDELGLRRLTVWLTTAQCTEYLNRWAAVVNGLTPQVVSMARRLTVEGYEGYAHINDAAAWKAIAPEDQEEMRERMAADFDDRRAVTFGPTA